jgi:hypothetical protein
MEQGIDAMMLAFIKNADFCKLFPSGYCNLEAENEERHWLFCVELFDKIYGL